jgi:hypothetical protein
LCKLGIVTIIFYKNGLVKDSVNCINDFANGLEYIYDSTGMLEATRTNYRGKDIGDHFLYYKGKVAEYYFSNFEKKQLVDCKYDSLGRCNYFSFNARPTIIKDGTNDNGDSVIELFVYFPHPSDFKETYELDIVDTKQTEQQKITLDDNRLYLDTLLSVSSQGWDYYMTINYRNISDDSLVTLYSNDVSK